MIPAIWFKRPISDSNCVWETLLLWMILDMSLDHFVCLLVGRAIVRFLVLITQPSTVFISSNVPSALSFLDEIISKRGKSSPLSTGRAMEWIAVGIALMMRLALSPKFTVMAMLSSI